MNEKAKIRKAVYIAVMWCILASVLLGCRKSNVESYASAEEAKQAMSQCRTFLVEGDLDEVNQEGNILADGKIAGQSTAGLEFGMYFSEIATNAAVISAIN